MKITDAAVTAAAKAYRAKVEWIDRHSRDDYGREDELGMRAALDAAAPYMLADAWDAAAALIRYDMEINQRAYVANRVREANPYRLTP